MSIKQPLSDQGPRKMPRETEENSQGRFRKKGKRMALRHPRNEGERLSLDRHLQRLGRDHRGRASKDQNGRAAKQRTNQRRKPASSTVDEFDIIDDAPDERITVRTYACGATTPFINQLTTS